MSVTPLLATLATVITAPLLKPDDNAFIWIRASPYDHDSCIVVTIGDNSNCVYSSAPWQVCFKKSTNPLSDCNSLIEDRIDGDDTNERLTGSGDSYI